MKKLSFLMSTILFVAISCSKFQDVPSQDETEHITLNKEAEIFYSNLSDIIKATTITNNITKSETRTSEIKSAEFYLEHEDEYPVQAKLATIDIELENGSIISYFDLPEDEQSEFVDSYTLHQAELLTLKIEQVPPLEQYVAAQNEVILNVLDDQTMVTKADGILSINDPISFFSKLSEEMNEMKSTFEYECDIPIETKLAYSFGDYEVEFSKVRSLIAGKANRGDIIVALPTHNYPKSLIDFGNKKYMIGHAEIFTKSITNTTTLYENVSIGAWTKDGVSRQGLNEWCWRSYVVGVCSYKVKWKWRGFKSGFYPVQTPVANPSLLATWAEKYEGREYVTVLEFLAPKWVAPERFTCTSLVWWCAKKAYGQKISPWYSTIVTPSDVLCDNNTYLKVTIQ